MREWGQAQGIDRRAERNFRKSTSELSWGEVQASTGEVRVVLASHGLKRRAGNVKEAKFSVQVRRVRRTGGDAGRRKQWRRQVQRVFICGHLDRSLDPMRLQYQRQMASPFSWAASLHRERCTDWSVQLAESISFKTMRRVCALRTIRVPKRPRTVEAVRKSMLLLKLVACGAAVEALTNLWGVQRNWEIGHSGYLVTPNEQRLSAARRCLDEALKSYAADKPCWTEPPFRMDGGGIGDWSVPCWRQRANYAPGSGL